MAANGTANWPQEGQLYCYQAQLPVDWWDPLRLATDKMIGCSETYLENNPFFWRHAKKAARLIGWEGDIRDGPYVFGLPGGTHGTNMKVGFVWKQENNGQTFVASPFRLPWLEGNEDECMWVRIDLAVLLK